jgi:hypothetical protein
MIVGFEWMWNRTKRLATSLYSPRVLAGAQDVVDSLDRYCELNGIDPARISIGEAKFIKGLQYVEYPLEQS